MAVSITAYETVTLATAAADPEFDEIDIDDGHDAGMVLLTNPYFPDRGGCLTPGWYRPSGATRRLHYSYSGYNYFREEVCRAALDVDPKLVWHDPDWFADAPLFEWVNFTDCEGFLGTDVCRRLADQADAVTVATASEAEWASWRELFRLAADAGAILYS